MKNFFRLPSVSSFPGGNGEKGRLHKGKGGEAEKPLYNNLCFGEEREGEERRRQDDNALPPFGRPLTTATKIG